MLNNLLSALQVPFLCGSSCSLFLPADTDETRERERGTHAEPHNAIGLLQASSATSRPRPSGQPTNRWNGIAINGCLLKGDPYEQASLLNDLNSIHLTYFTLILNNFAESWIEISVVMREGYNFMVVFCYADGGLNFIEWRQKPLFTVSLYVLY